MDVFIYNKSLQERLSEYANILSSRENIVPASQIRMEWSCHIELVIEPIGWQALWQIPRLTCEEFGIHYPNVVAVDVERIDFSEHSALVKIVAVLDEIHLPEKYEVPLIELYPTQKQENTALDILATAECIDQLRFFYQNLWMPWDINDDDTLDWVTNHLEARLRLFFDMKRGSVCKKTCDLIRTLMREGRDIQAKISKVEMEISDDEHDSENHVDDIRACELMKLHFRLQQIKNEVDVLENPSMRQILIRNQSLIENKIEHKRRESRGRQKEAHFVWLGGSLDETLEALKLCKSFMPSNIFIKTVNCLQEALDTSKKGDIIVIGRGEHHIKSTGNIEEGGILKGLLSEDQTILIPQETKSHTALLDFSADEVILENLTFDLKDLQAGIFIRSGLVKLVNCRMVVLNPSVTKLGIIVFPGAKLIASKTKFIGLGSCIEIHSLGEAVLSECNFDNSSEGIQLARNSKLSVENCNFTNIKEHGINIETDDSYYTSNIVGDVILLERLPGMILRNCRFDNNIRGNVKIRPFTKPVLSSQEEMVPPS